MRSSYGRIRAISSVAHGYAIPTNMQEIATGNADLAPGVESVCGTAIVLKIIESGAQGRPPPAIK
jgi:hypothetical protein